MKTKYLIQNHLEEFLYLFLLNDGDDSFISKERESHIKFHIQNGDYLNNLATIIDLMLQSNIIPPRKRKDILVRIREDLLFIQRNYKIIEK
jgi:hypothetical protein